MKMVEYDFEDQQWGSGTDGEPVQIEHVSVEVPDELFIEDSSHTERCMLIEALLPKYFVVSVDTEHKIIQGYSRKSFIQHLKYKLSGSNSSLTRDRLMGAMLDRRLDPEMDHMWMKLMCICYAHVNKAKIGDNVEVYPPVKGNRYMPLQKVVIYHRMHITTTTWRFSQVTSASMLYDCFPGSSVSMVNGPDLSPSMPLIIACAIGAIQVSMIEPLEWLFPLYPILHCKLNYIHDRTRSDTEFVKTSESEMDVRTPLPREDLLVFSESFFIQGLARSYYVTNGSLVRFQVDSSDLPPVVNQGPLSTGTIRYNFTKHSTVLATQMDLDPDLLTMCRVLAEKEGAFYEMAVRILEDEGYFNRRGTDLTEFKEKMEELVDPNHEPVNEQAMHALVYNLYRGQPIDLDSLTKPQTVGSFEIDDKSPDTEEFLEVPDVPEVPPVPEIPLIDLTADLQDIDLYVPVSGVKRGRTETVIM